MKTNLDRELMASRLNLLVEAAMRAGEAWAAYCDALKDVAACSDVLNYVVKEEQMETILP
jgi:hypothetical protein